MSSSFPCFDFLLQSKLVFNQWQLLVLLYLARFYGFVLMSIYTVFVVTAILAEVGVLPVNF